MSIYKPLRDELKRYLDKQQAKTIFRAYLFARAAHTGQKRQTGEDYICHPVAVASHLAKMRMDQETIMAALLHDVVEDTAYDKGDIEEQFGKDVAELVDGVTKLTQINFETKEEAQAENFRKMILAMSKDIRVILVKLADRLHNMQTLESLPAPKRRRIARETLDIYAPIANRLGMHNIRVELENLGFAAYYPMRYKILKEAVRKARGNRKEIMGMLEKNLRQRMDQFNLNYEFLGGREKNLYSIFKKMRDRHIPFAEIMDIYGFRFILDSVDSCYRALGVVHNLYNPIPQRFKDYIAIPKANGYQSLHTTLFGPYGVPIEVQIRTREMDQFAENGIAAHWLYKSGERWVDDIQLKAREWIKDVMEMQKSTGSSMEFVENVKIDLFPDEVYVFTPRGQIMKLPSGAVGVDFAYAVHSDVGNGCVAIKIDRQLAPLSTILKSGQTVEVITAAGARPNPAWLGFVVTGKARSNIKHFLKSQQQAESISLGRRLLEKALFGLGVDLNDLQDKDFSRVLQASKLSSVDELMFEIGLGNRTSMLVAQQLAGTSAVNFDDAEEQLPAPLAIQGTEGMVISYGNCCSPIPGDPILGVLDKGKGITVHRDNCNNLMELRGNPEACIPLCWEDDVHGDYAVNIVVELENRRGILASLTLAIAEAESNIDNIKAEEYDGYYFLVNMIITVRDRVHLAQVMRRIRRVEGVARLSRAMQGHAETTERRIVH